METYIGVVIAVLTLLWVAFVCFMIGLKKGEEGNCVHDWQPSQRHCRRCDRKEDLRTQLITRAQWDKPTPPPQAQEGR